MSGIYIHIPFCKKACHYCNFHFSTQLEQIDTFINALIKEIEIQKDYLNENIETIYLGGGTPSLLNSNHLEIILNAIHKNFRIEAENEFTLEANPDDIDFAKTKMWAKNGINRLSIGVQSFQEEALLWMNRAHNVEQSHNAIRFAQEAGIYNLSSDLIYGTPHLTDHALIKDIEILQQYKIPHISCYALTVEEKTTLFHLIEQNKIQKIDTEKQARHFEIIVDGLSKLGFEHYEISNFALPGHQSKHNSSYWKGKPYLGLGPSAHSFNTHSRQWNIANNTLYIKSLEDKKVPFEIEQLELVTQYNEYMMISLRLLEGFSMAVIESRFGFAYLEHTKTIAKSLLDEGKIEATAQGFTITKNARFLADGIASDFFIVD
jgi:oxygen-independent coproporphyrinogen III oxidase